MPQNPRKSGLSDSVSHGKTEEKDVMTGLGAGGDDYITKPFGIGELRARVAAHIRRENREKRIRSVSGRCVFPCRREKSMCRNMNLFYKGGIYDLRISGIKPRTGIFERTDFRACIRI